MLTNPGFLTVEYLRGKQMRYIPPLRLYIFISIVFFLILRITKQEIEASDDLDADFFETYFDLWIPRLFFFLLPLFALFTDWLFRKEGRYYLSSFVFSVHFHAFVLLVFTFYIIFSTYLFSGHFLLNQVLVLGILAGAELYLVVALRRVFERKWLSTVIRLLVVNLLYAVAVVIIFLGIAVLIYETQY